jgi:prepilin-type N-terminal cleavage/methylation domain-containing protein
MRNQRGFTLVELVIVIAILFVIGAAVVQHFNH